MSEAHRQVLIAEDDGHCLGCQVSQGDLVYVHTVETFGVASASYFPWADLRGKCVLLAQLSWPTQVIIVITIGTKKSIFVCTFAPRLKGTHTVEVFLVLEIFFSVSIQIHNFFFGQIVLFCPTSYTTCWFSPHTATAQAWQPVRFLRQICATFSASVGVFERAAALCRTILWQVVHCVPTRTTQSVPSLVPTLHGVVDYFMGAQKASA